MTLLEGLRVLDFTRVVVGPIASQLLADMGAEVYKVESIGVGDFSRQFFVREGVNGVSPSFLALNRNKRSICLDVRQPAGREIALRLANVCDVVIQNFRPGVMERLGLDYPALSRENPRLIYASASGYGLTGPRRLKAGQDLLAQAMSGVGWLTGEPDGPPMHAGPIIADYACGLLLVQGILAALWARERTGRGQAVSASLLDAMLHLQCEYLTAFLSSGHPERKNTRPLNRFYQTGDGKWLALSGTFGDNPVQEVCAALGLPDLSQDERFDTWEKANYTNGPALAEIFAERFRTRTRAEWLTILEARDILCAPVNTYAETFADEQVRQSVMVVEFDHPRAGRVRTIGLPIKFGQPAGAVRRPPPALGEHTDEILTMLDYSAEEIRRFRERRVVA